MIFDHPHSLVVNAAARGAGGNKPFRRKISGRFALGTYELGNWLALLSQYNGLSCSFLLTCGRIELVDWHPETVGHRSFGPIELFNLHPHTPACTIQSTCSRWYELQRLKGDCSKRDFPPPPSESSLEDFPGSHPGKSLKTQVTDLHLNSCLALMHSSHKY